MTTQQVQIANTPKTIWGKLIALTREERNIALHITCGNIVDVDIQNSIFIIRTTEKYVFDTLENSKEELKACFIKLGYNFDLKIEKIITNEELIDEDLEKLRKLVGNYLKIKE